ncbi:hopanoid-associated sugar epimerase [Granulicella paludicola]|uniref:hopanoid-associated sugar epimerase n=1 Tax=Granulicella paludicola TaxID=474951 RepID=UPI0021E04863|nr:hopanoid-associated sugar epimerase [Granulicella paludicola]
MRLFITGATGFVGAHVARLAAEQGADLRLLSRSTSNKKNLPANADIVTGDLRNPFAFASALQGCDALIHVAADYRLWVPDPAEMYQANVEGTRELLRLAREAGVPRVVYTSSVATMGFKKDGTVVDETTPVSEADMIGHYKRSKWLAEQVALEAARAGQHVMVLNPTTPIGALDTKPTPTGRIVVDFLNKNFPAYVDTGLNLVDVEEIARMHLIALERGTPGERYILGGENLTLKQILDRLAAITGLASPKMKVPHGVAMAFAFFDETITGKLRGKEPRATVEAVRMGRKMMFASSAKAERELGLHVQSVESALRAACEWFIANDYAPEPPAWGR